MLNKNSILAAFSGAGLTPSAKTNKELVHEFLSKKDKTVIDKWEINNSYSVLRSWNVDSTSEAIRRRFLSGYYHRREAVSAQYVFRGCHSILFAGHKTACFVHAYERDPDTLRLKWLCGDSPEELNHELMYHIVDCHILIENNPHVLALRTKLVGGKEPFKNLETGILMGDIPESYYLSEDGSPYPFKFIVVCNDIFKKGGITTERSGILKDFIPNTGFYLSLPNSPISGKVEDGDTEGEEGTYHFSLTTNPLEVEMSTSLCDIHSRIHPKITTSQVSGVRYMFNEPIDFKKNITLKRKLILQ